MAKIAWKAIDGFAKNVTTFSARGRTQYVVPFTYEVDGHLYAGTLYTFKPYREGDLIAVRYDATNPERNDISEKYKRKIKIVWAVGTLLVLLIAVMMFLASKPNR